MKRHHLAMAASGCAGEERRTARDATKQHPPVHPPGAMHTLVLLGELDRASAHTLEAEIEQLCEAGRSGITLDLSKLAYIDATGVAVIVFRCRLCQRRGYDFALIPGPPFVQHAFELAGVAERLPFLEEHTGPSPAAAAGATDAKAGEPDPAWPPAPSLAQTQAPVQGPGPAPAAARRREPATTPSRSFSLLRVSGQRGRARWARRGRGGPD
jgi:anti-anti-sigma factor